MPVIIFDSYDATGKTNYAEALSAMTGYQIPKEFTSQLPEFKNNLDHKFWSQAQYTFLSRIISAKVKVDMIMDRWVFTEYCYSPVLRDYSIEDYYWALDAALAKSDNLLWIYTDIQDLNFKDILRDRFIKNGESYVTINQTMEIKKNYDYLFNKSSVPRLRIDTSYEDPSSIARNLSMITQAIQDLTGPAKDRPHTTYMKGQQVVSGVTGNML